jgi:hypothetical protein
VDITPDTPLTTDDLVCTIITQSTDPDGDTVSYSYQWYKDGQIQPGLISNSVPAVSTVKGETWRCVVIPKDGTVEGPSDEDQVTIRNSPPTAPEVGVVTPDMPLTTDDLVCTITTPSTDPDGDTITYAYQWYKDAALQPALTTDTVPASNTAEGEVWRCVVTPNDGAVDGPSASDEVTVTAPPGGLATGAIVGIVVGVLGVIAVVFILLYRRRQQV